MRAPTSRFRLRPLLTALLLSAATTAAAAPEPYLYGPIRPGEQLTRIALALRADKTRLGTWQMAAALYRSNPKAFAGDNINRLNPGRMLMVPSDAEVRGIDPRLAQALADAPDRAAELLRSSWAPPTAAASQQRHESSH